MVYLKAKTYLKSIRRLDDDINAKQRVLDGLEKDKGKLCAVTYDGVKVVGGGGSLDPMSELDRINDKIEKLQREINEDIDRLIDLKNEAIDRIARVYNPTFITLLTDLYISGLTLERIAEKRGKSYETIKSWHGQALQIFRKENNMQ